jgi:hypothetical protein
MYDVLQSRRALYPRILFYKEKEMDENDNGKYIGICENGIMIGPFDSIYEAENFDWNRNFDPTWSKFEKIIKLISPGEPYV